MSIEREFIEAVASGTTSGFCNRNFPDVLRGCSLPFKSTNVFADTAKALLLAFPAPAHPRCSTCKSWSGPDLTGSGTRMRCRRKDNRTDGMTGGDRSPPVYTGPDFGCVHHEKREEKPVADPCEVEKLKAELKKVKRWSQEHQDAEVRAINAKMDALRQVEKLKAVADEAAYLKNCADTFRAWRRLAPLLKAAGYEVSQ